ncbi:SIMPL domain-containing protein [Microlunatus flavus]|uniref:SIMPL domain-containing protein n=1 Tax=Microlunatus flavus TaxID=1036181 RepID=A0A1H9MG22_9ACTN|nr:SIMPL domain-containing protein [Microlunatus flavus]SER22397.1 hypothetical protein SAMN05421756_110107 [Microlunatus flavus]
MSATPTVTVRGEGQVEGPPELATVSAVLHTSGRSAAEVTRSLAELARQVDAALPELTFDSVRTDPLSVSPVFDRRSGVRITGYTGRYATRLTLADFAGLSGLVVALTGLSGAQVDGPWWSLRPGSPLERDARRAAVAAAVARARDYAEALGATLGDLLELADTDAGGHGIMPRAFGLAKGGGEPPELDLEPQPQTVHASVTARFTLTDVPSELDL